jgi:hypothetical protein
MSAKTGAVKLECKDRLLRISDLNADLIAKMSEKQLQDYVNAIRASANLFPALREKLEASFRSKNYQLVFQILKSLRGRLVTIHADDMVADFDRKLNLEQDMESVRHEKLGLNIEYILSTLTMLYSDVQQFLEALEVGESVRKDKIHSGAVIKEKLFAVTELDAGKIKEMKDEQLHAYLEELSVFHEGFKAQENGLRNAVKSKQYSSLLRWLTAIEESLSKINAVSLLDDCRGQISQCKDIHNIRHAKLEVFVNYFLSSLAMLSEDIGKLNLSVLKQITKHLMK